MCDPTTTVLSSCEPTLHPYAGIPASWDEAMGDWAHADLVLIDAHHERLEDYLAAADPFADVEDCWESIARTAAAIRAARSLGRKYVVRRAGSGWTPEQMACRLGSVAVAEEQRHVSDPLLQHELLLSHGGRWMSLAGYSDIEGELPADRDVVQLALERARAGVHRAVIKFAERKAGVFAIDLWPEMTAADVEQQLMSGTDGWTFIRLAGKPATLVIQDWIPMAYEYRLFVVDGQVVSGAGCIEEHTPYSRVRHSDLFDTRVRGQRGHGIIGEQPSDVVDHPDLVRRYLKAGDELAELYGGTVTIDVALNTATDDVVLVELNTLPNSGLYASNPDAVYLALAQARDRGYDTYAWVQQAPIRS